MEVFHTFTVMKKILLLFIAVTLLTQIAESQVYGCTDPLANNYNPNATVNDGSCTYNVTLYNPPLKYLLPEEIKESSGLALYNEKYWTINDSGGLPVLYGFDTITGDIVQRITVSDVNNIDWEALADDENYIYIGDFGNNTGTRNDLVIYKIDKSDIPDEGDGTVGSEAIYYTYSDYSSKTEITRNHNFDCEAVISTDDWLFLFSKNRGDQQTKLYRLPKTPGTHIATLITTYNTAGLITGADYNEMFNEVTLIGYVDQSWIPFTWLLFDYEGDNFFSGNKRRIDMPNIVATQTEAIVYTTGRHETITSEGHVLFSQSAYGFDSGNWTSGNTTSIGDVTYEKFDFILSPNPVKKNKINIDISNLPVGWYQLEIYDTMGNVVEINTYSMDKISGSTRIKIKVGSYPPGIYFIRLSSGNQIVEKKFIKN